MTSNKIVAGNMNVAAVFQGHNSVSGVGFSTAVQGEIQKNVNAKSDVAYTLCEDSQSLYKALGFEQSRSIGVALFGFGEKSSFLESMNLTAHSINIVVRAYHEIGTEMATNYRLKPEVQPPVGDQRLKTFCYDYGDSFVSSITRGAECYAVLNFNATSSEQKKNVSIEISAKGIMRLFSGGGSIQNSLDEVAKSSHVSVTLKFYASGIANPNLPNSEPIDAFLKYAAHFISIPPDAPVILSYESIGYEHVPGVEKFDAIVQNRDYFVGDHGISQDLQKLRELLEDIVDLKAIYDLYGIPEPTLASRQQQVQKDIDSVNRQVQQFVNDPTTKHTQRPVLSSLALNTPKSNYHVGYSPSWGGSGGEPFDCQVNAADFVNQRAYINAISISTGVYGTGRTKLRRRRHQTQGVFQISVSYHSKDDSIKSEAHGSSGSTSNNQTLQPTQYVTKIVGRSGHEVDQLVLTLNDGKTISGGGGGGGPFSWTLPPHSRLLGFNGRSGGRLNQIKAVYVTLNPATW